MRSRVPAHGVTTVCVCGRSDCRPQITKLILIIFLVFHWFGCISYLLARIGNFDSHTWVSARGLGQVQLLGATQQGEAPVVVDGGGGGGGEGTCGRSLTHPPSPAVGDGDGRLMACIPSSLENVSFIPCTAPCLHHGYA